MTNDKKMIKEQRIELVKEMDLIISSAKTENRDLSKDEQVKWDELYKKEGELRDHVARISQQEKLNKELAENVEPINKVSTDEKEARNSAFNKYLKRGIRGLNSSERNLLELRGTDPQTTTTDAAGGYIVPKGFADSLNQKLMGGFSAVMTAARNHNGLLRTNSGNPLYYPNTGDSVAGSQMTEGSAVSVSDITFGNTILSSYTFTSEVVKISKQLLQDEGFDVNNWLVEILARRLAKGMNAKLTGGSGSSEPKGINTASSDSGVNFAADIPTLSEIMDVYHAVNTAYRNDNSCWFMTDSLWKGVKQMVSGTGVAGVAGNDLIANANILSGARASFEEDGSAGVIFGRPVYINEDLSAASASGGKTCVFGDMSQYKVRMVGDPQLLRMDERYADELNVGFILFHRIDGNLVTAATDAMVYAKRN